MANSGRRSGRSAHPSHADEGALDRIQRIKREYAAAVEVVLHNGVVLIDGRPPTRRASTPKSPKKKTVINLFDGPSFGDIELRVHMLNREGNN